MAEYRDLSEILTLAKDLVYRMPSTFYNGIQSLLQEIIDLPAADVALVVRCKVCQNSYEWTNADGDTYRYCGYLRGRWNPDYDRLVDDDDFCKWGAKMDGGKE